MEDISLHILDVAENAVRGGASTVRIFLEWNRDDGTLTLRISDDGRGMDEATQRQAMDPFFTTKTGSRIGLGLPLLRQAAEETGGDLQVVSREGAGTDVTATFRYAHPDMRPVGDLTATLAALVAGNPPVRFVFESKDGDEVDAFDSCGLDAAEIDDNMAGCDCSRLGEEE